MSKQEYVNKSLELLNDKHINKKLLLDSTRKIWKQHNDLIKLLNDKKQIPLRINNWLIGS